MQIVYLGLLSKVFDEVFEAILSPVFQFMSEILETSLTWLFQEVLGPLLEAVLWPLFVAIVDLYFDIMCAWIFFLYTSLLQVVDAMETAFDVFSGLSTVIYNDTQTDMTLLEVLFRLDAIQTAVWVLIAVGFALTFLFAVVATLRSMMDLELERSGRTISKVLSSTMKAMFQLVMIPVVCLFVIQLSGAILSSIDTALANTESTTLSRMVFCISSLDACIDENYNTSTATNSNLVSVTDLYRSKFYYEGDGYLNYWDSDTVKLYFDLSEFDYTIGFAGALFLIMVLGMCLMTFICRIFEVLMLFIVAPLFVSVMPLDDGERFKGWRDMFVGKIFSGYGSVVAMELYMILVPAVMSGRISFIAEGSTEAEYLIRLIFLLGGAWAVTKAGPTVTQLINATAGYQERESQAAGMGAITGMARTGAALAGSAFRGLSAFGTPRAERKAKQAENKAIKEAAGAASDERVNARFAASKTTAAADGATPGKKSGGEDPTKKAGGEDPTKKAGAGGEDATKKAGGEGGKAPEGDNKFDGEKPDASENKEGTPDADGKAAAGKEAEDPNKPKPQPYSTLFPGGHVKVFRNADGSPRLQLDFGKKLRLGTDENGKRHIQILGFGYTRDAAGNVDKVRLGSLATIKRGVSAEGKSSYSLTRFQMGGLKVKRVEDVKYGTDGAINRTVGSAYVSKLNVFGHTAYAQKQDGNTVQRTQMLGRTYVKNEATGQYVHAKTERFGFRSEYNYDSNGQRHIARVETSKGKSLYQSGTYH